VIRELLVLYFQKKVNSRIGRSTQIVERRSLDATKEARTFRQQEKTAHRTQEKKLEQFEEEEGLLYGPGIAD